MEPYYASLAAAYVRGEAMRGHAPCLPAELIEKPLHQLTQEERSEILHAGRVEGLKLYRFKASHELPRVKRVLSFLKGIAFDSLLDVGTGRGAFLWPFLDAFPMVDALSVDLLDHRVNFLKTTALGGITNLKAIQGDLCQIDEANQSRDIVTLLEVLEHIPDTHAALKAALRIARRYVILTVPSKPDNNPEHIHLFTKDSLTRHFHALGCEKLRFDAVSGHLILIVTLT